MGVRMDDGAMDPYTMTECPFIQLCLSSLFVFDVLLSVLSLSLLSHSLYLCTFGPFFVLFTPHFPTLTLSPHTSVRSFNNFSFPQTQPSSSTHSSSSLSTSSTTTNKVDTDGNINNDGGISPFTSRSPSPESPSSDRIQTHALSRLGCSRRQQPSSLHRRE